MFTFGIAGKVDWQSLGRKLESEGVRKVTATGGMGTFWHVYRLNGKQFSVVDDGDNDWVQADDESLLEEVKNRFFSDYKTEDIRHYKKG